MVRLRKIQVHARVDQGVGVVVGGVDGHYVGSDPNRCSATGPKREEIGRSYAGGRTTSASRNVVIRNRVMRNRVVNLEGCVGTDSGTKRETVARAQRAQVAAAKQSVGNCYAMVDRLAMVGNSLDVAEEEKLALDDGTADASAEIVIVVRVFSQSRIGKEIPGIPVLIPVVFITRTVELIGARLADLDYDQSARLAKLRRHAVLLNAEFLDGFYAWRYGWTAKHSCSNGDAVQDIVIRARAAAADPHVAFISAG